MLPEVNVCSSGQNMDIQEEENVKYNNIYMHIILEVATLSLR